MEQDATLSCPNPRLGIVYVPRRADLDAWTMVGWFCADTWDGTLSWYSAGFESKFLLGMSCTPYIYIFCLLIFRDVYEFCARGICKCQVMSTAKRRQYDAVRW